LYYVNKKSQFLKLFNFLAALRPDLLSYQKSRGGKCRTGAFRAFSVKPQFVQLSLTGKVEQRDLNLEIRSVKEKSHPTSNRVALN